MTNAELPSFLRSAEAFAEHLSEQFPEASAQANIQKGDVFLAFACRILPLCPFWGDFSDPEPSEKKTHDRGVDFSAYTTSPSSGVGHLYGQSKFKIRDIAALDSILSKFAAHERSVTQSAGTQGELPLGAAPAPKNHYVIVTATDLTRICKIYEDSQLTSRAFYDSLKAAGRIHILDGVQLLSTLQGLYRQSYLIAPELDLTLARPPLQFEDVFISAISGETLRAVYAQHGTSLFFENIRDFLGLSQNAADEKEGGVNDAILDTLRHQPEKMLGRNNGITFRADKVEVSDATHLRLIGGNIVNGCQTTMCVVSAGEQANQALIAVKVVVADDSWEVAKSANYQNRVSRIDLEIARFLRPQLVRKIAMDLGYAVPKAHDQSIATVLNEIHLTKVSYDAIKWLYLGIFSRHPNNIFDGIHSEVRTDALEGMSAQGRHEYVMRVLFQLWIRCGAAQDELRERFRTLGGERFLEVFKRFFDHAHLKYQCLLAILAACGCVNDDLMDKRPSAEEAVPRLLRFIGRLDEVLLHHPDYFHRVFRHAFGVITEQLLIQQSKGDLADLMQKMFNQVSTMSGSGFGKLCMSLRGRMINDDTLATMAPALA